MEASVYNATGETVGTVALDDALFGITPNNAVMHQALVRQQANARHGTHDTKTRGEVRGGGRKPYRQKGTGRARQGSTRSPQWKGGGTVWGPHPRKYTQAMPRKMRQLAIRSALSAKAANVAVLRGIDDLDGRTKAMVALLKGLDNPRSTLDYRAGAWRESPSRGGQPRRSQGAECQLPEHGGLAQVRAVALHRRGARSYLPPVGRCGVHRAGAGERRRRLRERTARATAATAAPATTPDVVADGEEVEAPVEATDAATDETTEAKA